MMTLLAGVFASVGMLFGGLFGGHAMNASTTPREYMHMASTSPSMQHGQMMASSTMRMNATPSVTGKVTSIDGTTITIAGHVEANSATTTYSIDASTAKFISLRSHTASTTVLSITSIHEGDTILALGTITGTSVVAKTVVDGIPVRPVGHMIPLRSNAQMHSATSSARVGGSI